MFSNKTDHYYYYYYVMEDISLDDNSFVGQCSVILVPLVYEINNCLFTNGFIKGIKQQTNKLFKIVYY